eukprot:6784381-Alexandrium_andersonii.AAC.1
MPLAGWNHVMHGVAEQLLTSSLRWFPAWSADARALAAFLGQEWFVDALVRELGRLGREDLQ